MVSPILWHQTRTAPKEVFRLCAQATSYLDGRDVAWASADIAPRDPETRANLPPDPATLDAWEARVPVLERSGIPAAVPVLEAGGRMFQGFNVPVYDQMLGLAPSPVLHERKALEALANGALFVVSHSGGKDSQAMLIRVRQVIPADRIVVVHVDMRELEWPGTEQQARYSAEAEGIPLDRFFVVQADYDMLEQVRRRSLQRPDAPPWSSAQYRLCTAALKRQPVERFIDQLQAREGWPVIVDVEGLRAAESSDRAGAESWEEHPRMFGVRSDISGMKRLWYKWLPIKHLSTEDVFATISVAGQVPHWAYAAGNERLSCMFCVLSSLSDLRNAAIHNPELFARFVQAEQDVGWTMGTRSSRGQTLPYPLEERIKLTVDQAWAEHERLYGGRARHRLPVVRGNPKT